MNETNDEAFVLVFNPYVENNPELTDDERLQLRHGVLFDSTKTGVFERSGFRQPTPPLTPDQLRLFAEALVEADLGEWPEEALPSGLWKCHNLKTLSCHGSKKVFFTIITVVVLVFSKRSQHRPQITSLSPAIGRMKRLQELNADNCSRLRFLPFEITHTVLPQKRHLLTFTTGDTKDRLAPLPRFPTGPLSLKETSARAIVRRRPPGSRRPKEEEVSLPEDLESYLRSAKRCSKCQGPFFDAYFACWSAWDNIFWKVPLLSISCSRRCARAIPDLMFADGEPVPTPPRPTYPYSADDDYYNYDGYDGRDEDYDDDYEEELLRDLL